jgi:hypothetical protein
MAGNLMEEFYGSPLFDPLTAYKKEFFFLLSILTKTFLYCIRKLTRKI